jgi:hypothetical protein
MQNLERPGVPGQQGSPLQQAPPQNSDRSLGELLRDLAQQTTTLVRDEVQLAQTEMTQKAAQAGRDVGMVAGGAAIAHAGALAIIAGIVIALAQVIAPWLAALIVGVVVVGAGYALAQRGMVALKRIDPVPRAPVQTLKEDQQWARSQTR